MDIILPLSGDGIFLLLGDLPPEQEELLGMFPVQIFDFAMVCCLLDQDDAGQQGTRDVGIVASDQFRALPSPTQHQEDPQDEQKDDMQPVRGIGDDGRKDPLIEQGV
jgi:hypothetical protein